MKRWEDDIRELYRNGDQQVPEGTGEQAKLENTGYTIISGASTTLTVNWLSDS